MLSLITLSHARVRLSLALTLSLLTIWCSGLTALFFFFLAIAAPAYSHLRRTLIPRPLSSHSALSSYELFGPLAFWQLSVYLRPLVQALRSCLASGDPRSSAMPPSLGRGRVTTTTTTTTSCARFWLISMFLP